MRQRLLAFAAPTQPGSVASAAADPPAGAVLREWIESFGWRDIETFSRCMASEIGFGTQMVDIVYGDSPEDLAPFAGVRLRHAHRDDVVVFPRETFDRIVADFLDFLSARPPDPLPSWWPSFLENVSAVHRRLG